jgi:hypothetical protein
MRVATISVVMFWAAISVETKMFSCWRIIVLDLLSTANYGPYLRRVSPRLCPKTLKYRAWSKVGTVPKPQIGEANRDGLVVYQVDRTACVSPQKMALTNVVPERPVWRLRRSKNQCPHVWGIKLSAVVGHGPAVAQYAARLCNICNKCGDLVPRKQLSGWW